MSGGKGLGVDFRKKVWYNSVGFDFFCLKVEV